MSSSQVLEPTLSTMETVRQEIRVPEEHAKRSARLVSIDLLRGGAALAVVLHHAINWKLVEAKPAWFAMLYAILDQGYLGVPLFFVISGFCIHLRWAKSCARLGEGQLEFKEFWKRRIKRLYPPYFVVLCLSMGLVLLAYGLGKPVPLVTLYPEPRLPWIGADFLAHALMLHGFHPLFDKAGGNPPFWTLAREEYFYIMYFGLLLCRRYLGLLKSFTLVVLAGILFQGLASFFLAQDSQWHSVVNTSAIVLWVQWCFGMVAVEAYYGLLKLPGWCKSGWMIWVWMIAAKFSDHYFDLLSPFLWGLGFFTMLNFFIEREKTGTMANRLWVRWLSGVGVFSYSLYLIHNPVRAVVKQLLQPLLHSDSLLVFLLITALITAAGYFAAKLFFHVVERRFLNTGSQT
jgi:peptidoglycan/LPS O-acetylase OafA/YrhL